MKILVSGDIYYGFLRLICLIITVHFYGLSILIYEFIYIYFLQTLRQKGKARRPNLHANIHTNSPFVFKTFPFILALRIICYTRTSAPGHLYQGDTSPGPCRQNAHKLFVIITSI